MNPARVFDLPVHRTSRWIFNCYVIEGAAGATTVVDPGLPSIARDAIELMQRLPESGGPVASVSTHGHSDHVGGLPAMRSDADSTTYLPRRCEQYLAGESPRVFGPSAMARFLPMYSQQPFSIGALGEFVADSRRIGFGTGKPFQFPYRPDGFLGQGGVLPGAEDWEVIEAPGHSDDALCFYHRESATLLSGDAVVTLDGTAWFNPEWVDARTSASTEERLRALEVRHLLPGHGIPISGDVWKTAMSFTTKPPARGILARCARAFGGW